MNEKLLKNVKCFLLDLDGTIYLGNSLIDGAEDFLKAVKAGGKKYCFLTNNSSRSAADYLKKLEKIGINAVPDEVLTSGQSAVSYLKKNYAGKSVYLLGTESLKKEFSGSGIVLTENKPDIVVVSYDTELTYEKLSKACLYITGGALYIATHPDINCPSERGMLPDLGSYMELIKKSTGKSCGIICGKPRGIMAEAVLERFNLKREEIAMVGDRLSTDIQFALNCGFVSVLVLSGETDMEMLEKSGLKPDVVLPSVKGLIDKI